MRTTGRLDWLIGQIDASLRTIAGVRHASVRPNPARALEEGDLEESDKELAIRLMRVNHAGEIAAQGLYHGQALLARTHQTRKHLITSAHQEADHLCWCEQRLTQLGGRTSLLAPWWYAGSFMIGLVAAVGGDRWSFAFIKETEDQVVEHLQSHLARLPDSDRKTRAIIEQVIIDEGEHASAAARRASTALPEFVPQLMRLTAKLMTVGADRI